MMENQIHPMEELKQQLLNILNVIPPKSKVYYLDYPLHTNIGDLLIYHGTEKFFEHNHIAVKARYSIYNFPNKLQIPQDHIIVFHGGGNLGDLWKHHQLFRERIIPQYPNHRIVILPQTVYFKDQENLLRAKKVFSAHRDLHIYARDKRSLDFLRTNGFSNNLYLSPDMAHELWPLTPSTSPSQNNLALLRKDKEINKNMKILLNNNQDILDWPDLVTKQDTNKVKTIKYDYRKRKLGDASAWYRFSDYLIHKAVTLFSQYNQIATSRLHGHILACLLDKENILYDNSYGKNSEYYHAWTHLVKESHFIE